MALITYLTTIKFGFGEVAGIEADLSGLGIARPMIVADKGILAAGLVEAVRDMPPPCDPPRSSIDTPTNPDRGGVSRRRSRSTAQQAATGWSPSAAARRSTSPRAWRCSPTHPGPLADYAAILGGIPRITAAVAPVDRDPDHRRHRQRGRPRRADHAEGRAQARLHRPHLIPKAAICDPELTLGLPAWLTAATGMDAVTHCVETYLSPALQPAGRGDRARRPEARRRPDRAGRDGRLATATPARR